MLKLFMSVYFLHSFFLHIFLYSRGFYWACYATGLGATLHELGHTFDLGHTKGGIMGRGFDDIYKYFIIDMFYYDNLYQKEHNPFYFVSSFVKFSLFY